MHRGIYILAGALSLAAANAPGQQLFTCANEARPGGHRRGRFGFRR